MEDKFHDIRPFSDEEFNIVKKRLVKNPFLISTIRTMVWPRIPEWLNSGADFMIRNGLRLRLAGIKSIDDFQKKILGEHLLKWVLDHSAEELTCSGLEKLDSKKNYIFISNHRDIALDSAIIDYLLHKAGHRVPFIAFGDNLLINEMVEDLIRINKAFIVKRNLPVKQQLKALKHLSEYINLIFRDQESIWIAQREGRAKDGIDQTNPAIIKMFHLAERKSQPDFSAFVKSMRIVPVAVSYERDPCDRLKARELHRIKQKGTYSKKSKDDLVAMACGISGYKGNIHVSFSKPLGEGFCNEKEVALAIDREIHQNYRLWPSNYIAWDLYHDSDRFSDQYRPEEKEAFLHDYENLKSEIRKVLFGIYAAPILSKESGE